MSVNNNPQRPAVSPKSKHHTEDKGTTDKSSVPPLEPARATFHKKGTPDKPQKMSSSASKTKFPHQLPKKKSFATDMADFVGETVLLPKPTAQDRHAKRSLLAPDTHEAATSQPRPVPAPLPASSSQQAPGTPHPAFDDFKESILDDLLEIDLTTLYDNQSEQSKNQPLRSYIEAKCTLSPKQLIHPNTFLIDRLVNYINNEHDGAELKRAGGVLTLASTSEMPGISRYPYRDFVLIVSELKITLDLIGNSNLSPEEKKLVLAPLSRRIEKLSAAIKSPRYEKMKTGEFASHSGVKQAMALLDEAIEDYSEIMSK